MGEICKLETDYANWTPTTKNINNLPEPIKEYIYYLETLSDPAGIIAENTLLRDEIKMLMLYKKGV